jgi:hypothetical protein
MYMHLLLHFLHSINVVVTHLADLLLIRAQLGWVSSHLLQVRCHCIYLRIAHSSRLCVLLPECCRVSSHASCRVPSIV